MTQEDKELLLKDLSARLPYMVKCCIKDNYKKSGDLVGIVGENIFLFSSGCGTFNINVVRPFLFPLSSMTEEQEKECQQIKNSYYFDDNSFVLFDWYNKNHFDYRDLIPMGLANDATGLNIY